MKRINIIFLLTIIMCMVGAKAFAYDISVKNSDGVTIYYNLNSNRSSVSVTYLGTFYSSYSNEYTGIVVIPETITYNGKTYNVTNIGEYAFRDCSGLTSVTIPNGVTSIGDYAFYNCSGLTSVTIANSVTSIGGFAFTSCTRLTSVTIPNSVTSIGSSAFNNCSGLTSVTIPESVTSIGNSAFYGCSGLTSVTIPNSLTRIGGSAFSGTAWYDNQPKGLVYAGNVAYKYKGTMPVNTSITLKEGTVGIASEAFYGCSGLTSVTIPNSVTSIGYQAFYNCSGLTSVTWNAKNYSDISSESSSPFYYIKTQITEFIIGDDVTSIPSFMCYGMSNLKSVSIPNSVTSIGSHAFYGCSGLTSVTIGNGVTSIGTYAFRNCSGLKSITWNAKNYPAFSNYSDNPFYDIRTHITEFVISDEVISIPAYMCYEMSNLKLMTIPNSVTSIGNYAFKGCSGLTSISIPTSVTSIGYSAFSGCSGLSSISIPTSVTSIGSFTFSGCRGLTSVTIPNSVTSINSRAFYNTTIKSLTIGSGIQTIASDAFSYSSSANGPTPPVKVVWLANTPPSGYENVAGTVNYVANNLYTKLSNATVYPFLNSMFEVDGIKYVPVSPSERTCDAIDCMYDTSAEDIKIGKTVSYNGVSLNVKDIKPYTCYMNNYIKSIDISNDGDIGNYAFYYCGSNQAMPLVNISNDGSIGQYAFSQTGMEKAVIKNNRGIGNSAFRSCLKLKTVELGQNITAIGSSTFQDCTNLESIEIPDNVKTLDSSAFYGCTSLKSAKTGNGVSLLNTQTFSGCTSLENVEIGTNITKISGKSGTYSNYGCFYNCSSLEQIKVPGNVKEIEDYVFYGCTGLKNVIIDNAEAELKLGSNGSSPIFSSCPLDSVYIGRNISYPTASSYGYSPFYRNTSLRTVHITDKETEISENEFYGCTNLKNVRIGDGVTYIGNWAFSGCSSIEYFSFGSAMQSIGKEAFSDCTAMTKLISHAMTPPVCDSQALDDISKWVCTLSVPKGTVSSYQQAAQWKEFFLINEFTPSEIENKEVNVILSSAGYATFYNTYNNFKIPVGLSAQVVTFDSYGNLSYNTIANGIIPKGVPVILKSNNKKGGTYTLTSTTESATYSGENLLHGSSSQTMTSNVNGVSTSGNSSYVYYKLAYGKSGSVNANKFGWYWGANNGAAFSIEGGKAWLALPMTSAQSKRAVLFMDDDTSMDDATSIDDIEQSCNNEANSIQYNMAGQRVDNSYNGIIIVNGKKIVR